MKKIIDWIVSTARALWRFVSAAAAALWLDLQSPATRWTFAVFIVAALLCGFFVGRCS